MSAVLPLAHAARVPTAGGKAVNLGRLIAAGAPVPEGFVIPHGALNPGAIDEAWHAHSEGGTVIVRSSAMGEDGAAASFAGQLDSIPGVSTHQQLHSAVMRVWESQWSERVRAYQDARGIPLAGMGVIVQRQIDARISGVLFTVSPTSSSEMLLEYCAGLGEALVAGQVDPGRVTIARDGFQWARIAEPDHDVPEVDRLLGDAAIRDLARLALDIERAFGAPQDIEWTIDGSARLWIVQARPITASLAEAREASEGGPDQTWSNANVNENFPQPISPLLYSIARAGYYHYFRNLGRAFGVSERRLARMEPALRQIIGVHGARMYYNLTSIHHVLRSAPFGDSLAASFNQFVGAEDTAEQPGAGGRISQAREVAVIAVKTWWQFLFLTRRVEAFERTADVFAAATHPDRLAAKTQAALLADFRAFLDIRFNRWKNASLADTGSMVCYGLLQRLLAREFPGADQHALHNTLLKALPGLASGVPPLKLWDLSRMIRQDAALTTLVTSSPAGRVLEAIASDARFSGFKRAFDDYLEHWGFRCSEELMLTVPSFQENPAPVIDLLKSYVAMDGESPSDLLHRQEAERLRETARVLRALRRRPLRRLLIRTVLRWTQTSIQLRERARFKQALLYTRLRRVALTLGRKLAAAGRLDTADDIFMLTSDEVELLASGGEMFPHHVRELVALRRRAHRETSETAPPDSIDLPFGGYLPLRAAAGAPGRHIEQFKEGDALTGVAACGGSATARAAILLDVTESSRLRAGDVLVTRQTDPGWGPIFPLISGLVIERGGMLSHGAIIAREFGIPAVVGVKGATQRIPHDARVTVDGNRGIVRIEGGDAEERSGAHGAPRATRLGGVQGTPPQS